MCDAAKGLHLILKYSNSALSATLSLRAPSYPFDVDEIEYVNDDTEGKQKKVFMQYFNSLNFAEHHDCAIFSRLSKLLL